MKTYLFDTLNRYKRFSDSLDIRTTICNKEWWVFNDTGEKQIYIFQEDGSLIISINGIVTNGNWKYISVNKALIINTQHTTVMLRPAFTDFVILSLQLDGTNNYAFLIDEANKSSFHPKSLTDIKKYLDDKTKELSENRQEKPAISTKPDISEQEKLERKINSILFEDQLYIELRNKSITLNEKEELFEKLPWIPGLLAGAILLIMEYYDLGGSLPLIIMLFITILALGATGIALKIYEKLSWKAHHKFTNYEHHAKEQIRAKIK